ncbi:putative glycolipid-binding protein [Aspergillus californicus]
MTGISRAVRWYNLFGTTDLNVESVNIKVVFKHVMVRGEIIYDEGKDTEQKMSYQILLDERFGIRGVKVQRSDINESISIYSNGEGRWFTNNLDPLPGLDGCIDFDISTSKSTKAIPIARMNLDENDKKVIRAVQVPFPSRSLEILVEEQRYTFIERDPKYLGDKTMLWRYEMLSSGFMEEFITDEDGLFFAIWEAACENARPCSDQAV